MIPEDSWFAIVIIGGIILLAVVSLVNARNNEVDDTARQRSQLDEAQRFVERYKELGHLPTRHVDLILKDGEQGVFQEPSWLHESSSYRVYGGAGTRIGGITFGGGASESHQRLKALDAGNLILTTQRLVFDGQKLNRAVKLSDVLSVAQVDGGIEVSTARRQKSQVYTVGNPSLWKSIIENLASGKLKTE